MLLYIELEDYLAQWFRHEQGGTDPVRLTRGSIESGLLEQFLQTPPPDYVPDFGATVSSLSSCRISATRTHGAITTCPRKRVMPSSLAYATASTFQCGSRSTVSHRCSNGRITSFMPLWRSTALS